MLKKGNWPTSTGALRRGRHEWQKPWSDICLTTVAHKLVIHLNKGRVLIFQVLRNLPTALFFGSITSQRSIRIRTVTGMDEPLSLGTRSLSLEWLSTGSMKSQSKFALNKDVSILSGSAQRLSELFQLFNLINPSNGEEAMMTRYRKALMEILDWRLLGKALQLSYTRWLTRRKCSKNLESEPFKSSHRNLSLIIV